MNLSEENKKKLQKELLDLKLKESHSVHDKYRIQTLQQLLFGNQ
jgi:hypothetical protein